MSIKNQIEWKKERNKHYIRRECGSFNINKVRNWNVCGKWDWSLW
jgi:hypothetical protein